MKIEGGSVAYYSGNIGDLEVTGGVFVHTNAYDISLAGELENQRALNESSGIEMTHHHDSDEQKSERDHGYGRSTLH